MAATKIPVTDIVTLGPGTLIFDKAGGGAEFSATVTSVKVDWSADAEDSVTVLSGDVIPGNRRYTSTLAFTTYQTLKAAGVIDWSWKNRGKNIPFEFRPLDGKESGAVTGMVVVDPISLGGEVGTKPTSECEWAIIGDPIYTPPTDAA